MYEWGGSSDDASTDDAEDDQISISKDERNAGDDFSGFGDDDEAGIGDAGDDFDAFLPRRSAGESHDRQKEYQVSSFARRARPPARATGSPNGGNGNERRIESLMEEMPRSMDLSKDAQPVLAFTQLRPQTHPTPKIPRKPANAVRPLPDVASPHFRKEELADVAIPELQKTEDIPSDELEIVSLALHQLQGANWLGNTAIFRVLQIFAPPDTVFFDLGNPLAAGRRTWDDWVENRHYDVRGATEVFVPLHLYKEKHWILLHFNLAETRATFYDSMKSLISRIDLLQAAKAIVASFGLQWDNSWELWDAIQVPEKQMWIPFDNRVLI